MEQDSFAKIKLSSTAVLRNWRLLFVHAGDWQLKGKKWLQVKLFCIGTFYAAVVWTVTQCFSAWPPSNAIVGNCHGLTTFSAHLWDFGRFGVASLSSEAWKRKWGKGLLKLSVYFFRFASHLEVMKIHFWNAQVSFGFYFVILFCENVTKNTSHPGASFMKPSKLRYCLTYCFLTIGYC